VPAPAVAERAENTGVFDVGAVGVGGRPDPDLPGAADFAGLFTVR